MTRQAQNARSRAKGRSITTSCIWVIAALCAVGTSARPVFAETVRSGDIEITVRPDGCGLVDEVKYRGEVVMSTAAAGRVPTPGFEADAERAVAAAKLAAGLAALNVNAPCRMSEATSARGHKLITLENGFLKVTATTWFGGRIIRLESKLTGANLLDNPYEDRPDEVKEPKDMGGIWGELDDKIFQPKVVKRTDDEIVLTLSSEGGRPENEGGPDQKIEKTLRLCRGSPVLEVEQKQTNTGDAPRSATNHLFGRFLLGGSVGPEDVLWGSSRGEAVHARKQHPSPNCFTDPKTDHWAALCDVKEGSALVSVFDGPLTRIGTWIRENFYQLEWLTPAHFTLTPGKEMTTTLRLIPCFNMGGVSFAGEDLAVGIVPEYDVLPAAAATWPVRVTAVSFTRAPRRVTLSARLSDRHGRDVRMLKPVDVLCPFLVAQPQPVAFPVGDLPAGEYQMHVTVRADGKELGKTALKLRRLGAGPVLDLFRPAPEEAKSVSAVLGSVQRGRPEVASVARTGPDTIRVTGKHVFGESSSPFTTEIRVNKEGDGFEIRHTLVCNTRAEERVRTVGLELPLMLGNNYHRIKTTVGGQTINDAWRVDQTDEVVSTATVSDWFSRWPLWQLGGVLQDAPTHYRIWKASAWDVAPMTTLEGTAAPGWVEATNGRWGVRIEMPRMADSAPKGILVDGHAGWALVYFFPPQVPPVSLAGSGDTAAPGLAERLGWRRGVPWTNTVTVRFHQGPRLLGSKRELSEEAFRALLETLGEVTVTRSMRALALPGGSFEECVQHVLDSELTARDYIRQTVGRGYRLRGLCNKLGCAYTNDYDATVDALIAALKEKYE